MFNTSEVRAALTEWLFNGKLATGDEKWMSKYLADALDEVERQERLVQALMDKLDWEEQRRKEVEKEETFPISIVDLMVLNGGAESRSHAQRLVAQGAVKLDGVAVTHPNIYFDPDRIHGPDGGPALMTVGKRLIEVLKKGPPLPPPAESFPQTGEHR